MESQNIEQLFNKLKNVSRKNRKTNHKFDGRSFWQGIKKILETSDYESKKWKNVNKTYYNKIMKIPEFYITPVCMKNGTVFCKKIFLEMAEPV
jgi:hypothetical protein